MIRHAAAVVVVLCLTPASLEAQDAVFTVNASSATVHLSPSTGSAVIGRAPRGSRLEVRHELGSWVKVTWPDARDGSGFVHVSTGSVARRPASASSRAAAATTPPRASGTAPLAAREEQTAVHTSRPVGYVVPPVHHFGIGGTMGGPTFGVGGTARFWSRNGFGLQVDASRHVFTSSNLPSRVTSYQFGPSVLYSLADHVTDYVRVRPYVGAGTSVHRQTLSDPFLGGALVSDTGVGYRAFGGTEFTLASLPRLGLSVDAGYQTSPAPFEAFAPRKVTFVFSGHWYLR